MYGGYAAGGGSVECTWDLCLFSGIFNNASLSSWEKEAVIRYFVRHKCSKRGSFVPVFWNIIRRS